MIGELFTKNMKLAEIINADCRLLYVLPRFGIKLGFGDATIIDVCKKYGVDENLFTLICNIYAFDDYVPKICDIYNIPLEGIMLYLKKSHSDYLNKRIPHIIQHVEYLAGEHHTREQSIIEQFCESYKKEVIAHFSYEEEVVFPYINSLINKCANQQFKIDDFLDNHSNIEDKLNDLKSIIMKYVEPYSDDDANSDLLIDLFQLDEDLKRHTIIEEKILVSLVEIMEQSNK